MTDRNANRPGYKKTKVGWIPEEWECVPLGEVYDVQLGKMLSSLARVGKDPQPYLANFNVRWASFDHSFIQKMDFSETERKKFELRLGDLLVCEGGEPGRCAIWTEQIRPCYFQKALHRLRAKDGRILNAFAQAFLFRMTEDPIILNLTSRTSIAHLTREKLLALPLPLPPLPEQKKIVEILSAWDEAIEHARRLVAAAKRRKKGLMQQLLTGKRRLPGFGGKWPVKKMSQVSRRITESPKSTKGYAVLSITAGTGFVSQEEKFSRVIAGRHIENYILLKRGEFAYNKGNSYRFPQGCAYRLSEYDEGLVPDVFFSFRVISEVADEGFVEQFFRSGLHGEQLRQWVNTGVRNNGLLNLNAADFFNLKIPSPALAEQRAIAAVLSAADEEIKALETECAALEHQKKGLMQKLLTGEARVIK
ncbi:MAG: restriction endonuclease subunit S [Kiritimatiellia bacterium]